jgi:predicted metalloenzyme YecM
VSELKNIIGNYSEFLDEILGLVVDEGFEVSDFVQLDHMCYRTISNSNYEDKKVELASIAKLLGETLVNGRPISTFRLEAPVIHSLWRIDAIELPAPKAESKHKLRAADRGVNPEISLQLGELSVKFHLLNLTTVVYLEQKLDMDDIKDGQ